MRGNPWPIRGMGADVPLLPSSVQVPATTVPLPTLANLQALSPSDRMTLAIYSAVGGVLGYVVAEKIGAVLGVLGGAVVGLYRRQTPAAAPAPSALVSSPPPAAVVPATVVPPATQAAATPPALPPGTKVAGPPPPALPRKK
jgi:hypothetical protein